MSKFCKNFSYTLTVNKTKLKYRTFIYLFSITTVKFQNNTKTVMFKTTYNRFKIKSKAMKNNVTDLLDNTKSK